jgi:hypothetical protein
MDDLQKKKNVSSAFNLMKGTVPRAVSDIQPNERYRVESGFLTFNLMKGTVSRAVAFLKPTSLAY